MSPVITIFRLNWYRYLRSRILCPFKKEESLRKKIFHDYYILLSILANIVFTQQNQQKMDSGHNLPVFSMQK